MKGEGQEAETRSIAVIGGGAAGFFAALTAAEADPRARVTLFERGRRWLGKVKVSGGGRCNVTHACFDPDELAARYPRGARELRAAFHRWQPRDTVAWFADRGVRLKTEPDGRMFPVSDDSQTIIDCFFRCAEHAGLRLERGVGLQSLGVDPAGGLVVGLSDGGYERADAVCIAAGSLRSSSLLEVLTGLGHRIEPLAPSLFAFDLVDPRIEGLAGIAVQSAQVSVAGSRGGQCGPLLVTHRGLSGPAILRLSAWAARALQERSYHFELAINWLGDRSEAWLSGEFERLRTAAGGATVRARPFDGIPRRLWERLVAAAGIEGDVKWAQLSKAGQRALARELADGRYQVHGKTTNKDEFVTCGGVRLREVDFRRMESRIVPGLYFAGECLDIDGITGGFNFQAAWTTARIAGLSMAGAGGGGV